MKLYGYYSKDQDEPVDIQEVTLEADPQELEKLAQFFTEAAKRLSAAEGEEHMHYRDFLDPGNYEYPDLIIYRAEP